MFDFICGNGDACKAVDPAVHFKSSAIDGINLYAFIFNRNRLCRNEQLNQLLGTASQDAVRLLVSPAESRMYTGFGRST